MPPPLRHPSFWFIAIASAAVLAATVDAGAEIFFRYGSPPADEESFDYTDGSWFQAKSGSYGITRDSDLESAVKSGTSDLKIGIGTLKPLGLAADLNLAIAPLAQAAANGSVIGDVQIHLAENIAEGGDKEYFRAFAIINLTQAFVSGFETKANADDRPWYQAFLNYNAISMTTLHPAPENGSKIRSFTSAWNLVDNTGKFSTSTSEIANLPPRINAIGPLSTSEDSWVEVSVRVDDPDDPNADLSVKAVSDNTTLLSPSGITVSGSGSVRTLKLQPNTDQHGIARVTVTASDRFTSVSESFRLTVLPVEDDPQITSIDPQLIDSDSSLTFPIDPTDADQPSEDLLLSATSSNQNLIPDHAIEFDHDGSSWQITLTPIPGQSGSADITITATDSAGNASNSTFLLTVNSIANTAPTDITLTPAAIPENSSPGTVVGTLVAVDPDGDPEISFALERDAGGRFQLLDGNQIATSPSASFDFESRKSHSILVRATDSQGATFGKFLTISVLNVNEPPSISVNLPPTIPPASPPGIPLPYPSIEFSDPDSNPRAVNLQLHVMQGTLYIDASAALADKVSGNGTSSLEIQAPIVDILDVISSRGLTYTSTPGYIGPDQLSASIDDLGNRGIGSPLTATASDPFFVKVDPLVDWHHLRYSPEERDDPKISGLLTDGDGDELSTLLEYKLAKDPRNPDDAWEDIEIREIELDGQPYLQISFVQRTDDSDPNTVLTVEVTDGSSEWTSNPAVIRTIRRTPLGDGLERLVVQPSFPRSSVSTQFFRFKVEYSGFSSLP